jgi:O-antigen/teichoic acid export membrane protein
MGWRAPKAPPPRPAAPNGGDATGLGEIARGSTLNLGGAAVVAATTLGVTVLVTRHFSAPVAGAFFTATSLFLLFEVIAGLGAYAGVIYFIPRLRSLGAESRIPIILRAAIVPVAVCSVVAAGVLLLAAGPLARGLLGGHVYHDAARPAAVADALRALAVTLPFAALLDTVLGATRGYRDMRPTVAVDRVGRSCLQLLGVLAAAVAGSAALLAPLWSLPYIPAAAIAWIWLRRIRHRPPPARTDGRPWPASPLAPATPETQADQDPASADLTGDRRLDNANSRGFWMFTAPRGVAALAMSVVQRLDIVLVGILRGPVEAAIYTAATRFLVLGQFGNAAISMAAQPQFSHLFAEDDRHGANVVYQVTTAWLIILTWPLYLLAVIYRPEVLAIFGHSYRTGTTVIVILGLAMLLATACGQVDIVLTSTGRSSWSLANGLVAVVVNVALDLALIPRHGITGAAIGWAAAIVVSNLIPLVQVAWVVRVHPFGTGTLVACVLTTLGFCGIPLLVRSLLGTGLAAGLLAIAAGCGALAAGLWQFREPLQLSAMPGLSFVGRHPRASGTTM